MFIYFLFYFFSLSSTSARGLCGGAAGSEMGLVMEFDNARSAGVCHGSLTSLGSGARGICFGREREREREGGRRERKKSGEDKKRV